jgi:hypothetical protein
MLGAPPELDSDESAGAVLITDRQGVCAGWHESGLIETILALLVRLCALTLFLSGPSFASTAASSLVKLEIRYELPAAGEVSFIWGVNGWSPVPEDLRPPGTVIRKEVMSTPMVRQDGRFVVTIEVQKEAKVDYGFLLTKTAGGAFIEVWDVDASYRFTATNSDVVNIKSVKLYQDSPVVMDRAGALLGAVLLVLFAGLLATACWLLWSRSQPVPVSEPLSDRDLRFAIVVSAAALICGAIVILHHEMWRDELQAWGIATSSRTLSELFRNARYEGHPPIWYLCLYVLSRFSDDPRLMQLFHLAVGTGSIFLLCRYAPFTRWQKIWLSFGYFPFYEYLIISRNYALGVLALWAFCAVQSRWPGRVLISAFLLAVMINTSAFGAIIAVALGGWLLLESFSRRRALSVIGGVGVVVMLGVGLAVAGLQSAPPADNSPRMLAWSTILSEFHWKRPSTVSGGHMSRSQRSCHIFGIRICWMTCPISGSDASRLSKDEIFNWCCHWGCWEFRLFSWQEPLLSCCCIR